MPPTFRTAPTISGGVRQYVLPVAVASDWVDVCLDPAQIDNEPGVQAAGVVVNPGAIARAAQTWLAIAGLGTSLQARLKYPTAATVSASPVAQVFGRDRQGRAQRLVDAGGLHAQTLSVDVANDVRDGVYSYTQPIEVDADGCAETLVAIRTALAGTGLAGATIQARVK
ncbi:MAG: hypothetical protein K1X71_10645 [Pirellulales bacterium]|nr:hypothetical protein [Pirellulales bacterium]